MKKLFLLLTTFSISNCLFAQQDNLLASAKKDSTGVFIGDMRATEQVESPGIARKYSITNLKKDLDALDKNNKNSILTDASSNNERNLNGEIFATYISRLDKKSQNEFSHLVRNEY